MAQSTTATATAPVEHDAHAHAHHPRQQHHFVSMDQQFDAAKLGMWLFLITEILLFSGMFVAYAVFRVWYPETYTIASEALDPWLGGINTLVLLTSSLTVALSINFIQRGKIKQMNWMLVATIVLAGVFMVIKYFEYTAKFDHGLFPGEHFHPHGEYTKFDVPYAPQFFSIYFVMTGIHGFHVLVGMVVFGWLLTRGLRGHFNSEWYTPVELTGLYWHVVDIIWIFLFPLMYLI
jgi:cytochrome c oxidase subunit 3